MARQLPIGEFASCVGLAVSALRFYDDAGVLKPVRVDGQTGYRYYAPAQVADGRLLRQLRAAGMPLALVREILGAPPERARHLIAEHLVRAERRLEDARRSASAAIRLLDSVEDAMTTMCAVDAADLKEALGQVLHATPGPGATRVPDGVLVAVEPDALRLAATDGHRLAIRDLATSGSGEATVVLLAAAVRKSLVDLPETGRLNVELVEGHCHLGDIELPVLQTRFPPFERILPDHRPSLRASFEVAELRRRLHDGGELAVLSFEPGSVAIGFNRDFLLEALDGARGLDVLMEADGPESPCLIRWADDGSLTYLLMPVRLLTPA
ncbi:MAG: MerR family transcriptional regulator [Candidatus Dormibacteraceae bacterium]